MIESMKVSELAEQFLAKHVAPKRKRGTKVLYEDILNRIVIPELGAKRAKDVTRAELAKLHLDWSHTPFQANRLLAVVASMFTFAGKSGLVPEGWTILLAASQIHGDPKERLLRSMKLERLGIAIREAETTGIAWDIDLTKKTNHLPTESRPTVIGKHTAAALRLLLLTGARVGEILSLKWEHVDFERGRPSRSRLKDRAQNYRLKRASRRGSIKPKPHRRLRHCRGQRKDEDEKPRSDLKTAVGYGDTPRRSHRAAYS